jgi:ankyrin repeat protein
MIKSLIAFTILIILPMVIVYQSPTWIRQAAGLPTGNSRLLDAATVGDVAEIRDALRDGIPVNTADSAGYTALHSALMNGNPQAVQVLLDAGADVAAVTSDGTTCLALAAGARHWDLIPMLLKAGADPNQRCPNRITPLYIACLTGHGPTVELLLDAGADVNARASSGATPAIAGAVAEDDAASILRQLIRHGADINAAEQSGYTPLMYAAERGQADLVCILLAYGADPIRVNHDGRSARMLAEQMQNWQVASLLRTAKNRRHV